VLGARIEIAARPGTLRFFSSEAGPDDLGGHGPTPGDLPAGLARVSAPADEPPPPIRFTPRAAAAARVDPPPPRHDRMPALD
jgi:hypothetical protein